MKVALEQDASNQEENRTESLEMYIAMLYDAGFSDVDCLWRDFWMGVLIAKKELLCRIHTPSSGSI